MDYDKNSYQYHNELTLTLFFWEGYITMDISLHTDIPSRIKLAIEENLFSLVLERNTWTKGEVHDDPDMIWSRSDFPYPFFNIILRPKIKSDHVEETLEKVVSRYHDLNVPIFWLIGPETKPNSLGKHLSNYGFKRLGEAPGMAIDLSLLNKEIQYPLDLRISVIENQSTLDNWAQIWGLVFNATQEYTLAFVELAKFLVFDSPCDCVLYIGTLKNDPVAISMAYFGAGVAGIYNVGTIPSYRGNGIGTAMTVFSLLDAKNRGYHLSTLHSSDLGLSVYKKIGFYEFCKIEHFIWEW